MIRLRERKKEGGREGGKREGRNKRALWSVSFLVLLFFV